LIINKYPNYQVINLDALTYAGNLYNLKTISNHPKYRFIHGDIRDRELIRSIFTHQDIDYVVNFAAESHVDRSIDDPDVFISTNVLGTQILLENALNHWKLNLNDKNNRDFKKGVKFLQISTDEVYGTLGSKGKFTEKTPLAPNSPYSASKAGADLIVRAYYETFGLPTNITRCSNNYGPHQYPEKMIPVIIKSTLENKKIPVYGDGLQIRDWIFVKDHCEAIDVVLHEGKFGEIYNIGGNNEITNLELVKIIIKLMNASEDLIEYVIDRPGHDRRYAIDNSKIINELNWEIKDNFIFYLTKTIEYYKNQ
jgi:dTDP-glucose 4,6-dehydratase